MSLISGVKILFLTRKPNIKPIKKHPKMLVTKVATGKFIDQYLATITDVKYLKTLPIAPPIAIYNKVFIIFISKLKPTFQLKLAIRQ